MSLGQTPNVKPRQATTAPKPPSRTEEVDPDDVVRIDTTLVNSPVLVIGRDGRFVPNLKREDFQIFEDGIQQDVAFFAPVLPRRAPVLHFELLIDRRLHVIVAAPVVFDRQPVGIELPGGNDVIAPGRPGRRHLVCRQDAY